MKQKPRPSQPAPISTIGLMNLMFSKITALEISSPQTSLKERDKSIWIPSVRAEEEVFGLFVL